MCQKWVLLSLLSHRSRQVLYLEWLRLYTVGFKKGVGVDFVWVNSFTRLLEQYTTRQTGFCSALPPVLKSLPPNLVLPTASNNNNVM